MGCGRKQNQKSGDETMPKTVNAVAIARWVPFLWLEAASLFGGRRELKGRRRVCEPLARSLNSAWLHDMAASFFAHFIFQKYVSLWHAVLSSALCHNYGRQDLTRSEFPIGREPTASLSFFLTSPPSTCQYFCFRDVAWIPNFVTVHQGTCVSSRPAVLVDGCFSLYRLTDL